MLPYLLLAMLPGTVLCAFLAFSDRVIYPRYTLVPRVAGVSVPWIRPWPWRDVGTGHRGEILYR